LDLYTWLPLLIYIVIGIGLAVALFSLSLVGRKRPNPTKALPFESGILTVQPTRQRFSIDFYLTAMLFIVFDVELTFMYPIATVLRDEGAIAVWSFMVFSLILIAVIFYEWRKKALEWR